MATGSSGHPDPPPPPQHMDTCLEPNCDGVLGDLRLCLGMGTVLQNYNRWYQMCTKCNRVHFYGELTRIEDIPEDVQLRHVLNASIQQEKKGSDGVSCTYPGCNVQKNGRPRNANKGCSNKPALCSHCCALVNPNGNCRAHRRATLSQAVPRPGRSAYYTTLSQPGLPIGPLPSLDSSQPSAPQSDASGSQPALQQPPSSIMIALQPAPHPLPAVPAPLPTTVALGTAVDVVAPGDPGGSAQPAGLVQRAVAITPSQLGPTHQALILSSGPVPHSRERPTTRVSSYARPLSDDYGQGYVKMSQQKAEQAALVDAARTAQQQVANMMSISIWIKQGEGPEKLDVTSRLANVLIVSDHRCLLDILGISTSDLIRVYNASERMWRVRQVNLPIPIPPTRYILLRLMDLADDDCLDLNEEIAAALGLKKQPRLPSSVPNTPSKVRKFTNDSFPKTPHRIEEDDTSDELALILPIASTSTASLSRPAESPTVPRHSDRAINLIPFPPLWACDMAERIAPIAHFNSHPDVHFSRAFPNSKYNSSTFYEHRGYYREARKLGILQQYVAAGRMPGGEWRLLTKRMKDIKNGKVPVPLSTESAVASSSSCSLPSVAIGTASGPPSDTIEYIGRLEWFEGCSSADFSSRWSPQTDGISLAISRVAQQVGHLKDIYRMSISEPDRYSGRYVAKTVRLSDVNWMKIPGFYNEANINFREAERVARAGDIAAMFVYEASEVTPVHHFQFVPTYVVHVRLESDDMTAGYPTTWIAQKYLAGNPFVAPEGDAPSTLLALSLDAFGHYALERHELLLDSFEGIFCDQGLQFYSCKMHTRYGDKMHIQDRGPYAVNSFGYQHKCNLICHALHLSAIPVDSDFELIP